jgi:hypothetical protein
MGGKEKQSQNPAGREWNYCAWGARTQSLLKSQGPHTPQVARPHTRQSEPPVDGAFWDPLQGTRTWENLTRGLEPPEVVGSKPPNCVDLLFVVSCGIAVVCLVRTSLEVRT